MSYRKHLIFVTTLLAVVLLPANCPAILRAETLGEPVLRAETLGEPVATSGDGALYKIGRFKLVRLRGDWHEMGRQYGALMRNDIKAVHDKMRFGYGTILNKEKYDEVMAIAEEQLALYPKRFRELHRGILDGSGLSLREVAVAEHVISAFCFLIDRGVFCSSLAVWGDFSSDGRLIFGRHFDFPILYRVFAPQFCVTVFHPTDGSEPVATLGYAGQMGCVQFFNAAGLTAEVNIAMGLPRPDDALHIDRISVPVLLTACGFDCSTLPQLDAALRTYRFNFPLLCTVADMNGAKTFEAGTRTIVERSIDEPGLNTVSNWALDDFWKGKAVRPFDKRRENLQASARERKGQIDFDAMKTILERKCEDGGACETSMPAGIRTLYQYAYEPKTRRLAFRLPAYEERWTEVPLQAAFAE